jgi:Mg-chelatase subunit ChlD
MVHRCLVLIDFATPQLILLLPFFIALTFMSHYFAVKIKRGLEVFHYPPVKRLVRISAQKALVRQTWRGISLALKLAIIVLIALSLAGPVVLTTAEIGRKVDVPMVQEKDLMGSVVFAVDVSASMGFNDVNPSRLEATKDLLMKLVGNSSQPVRFGIVGFEAEIKSSLPPTQDRQLAVSTLNGLRLSEALPCLEERTDIGYGIDAAVNLLMPAEPSDRPYAIILISDGYANYGYPDPMTSVNDAINAAISAHIPIYALHVAKIGLDSNPDLMKLIANETGGKFVESTDYAELQQAFETLSKYDTPTSVWTAQVEITTTVPQQVDLGSFLMLGAIALLALLWIGNFQHYKTWF